MSRPATSPSRPDRRTPPRASRRTARAAAALAVLAASALTPSAGRAQGFDFESVALGSYPTLSLTSGAQTLTVTSTTGAPFQVASGPPGGMGTRALLPANVGGAFLPFRFSFAAPVGSATFVFGDFAADDDSPVVVQAFDLGGALLGTFSAPYPVTAVGASSITAAVGGAGASYFIATGTGVSANSLYWEIGASTPAQVVPEPATWTLTLLGLTALGARARRRAAPRSR